MSSETGRKGDPDSDLHDLRALAETARQRLTDRSRAAAEPDPLLTVSSSGLGAVALPPPVTVPVAASRAATATAVTSGAATSGAATSGAGGPRTRPRQRALAVALVVVAGAGAAAVAVVRQRDATPAPQRDAPLAAPVAAAPVADPAPPVQIPAPAAEAVAVPSTPADAVSEARAVLPHRATTPASAARRAQPVDAATATAPTHSPAHSPAQTAAAPAANPAPTPRLPAGASAAPASIDELLDQAAGPVATRTAPAPTATAPARRELSRDDIKAGMTAVRGRAEACFARYGIPGSVGVRLTVAPTGRVTRAQATGTFAGTPTGDCVIAAVEHAEFPAWSGAQMTLQYSFLLSE